jgi:phosphatidylglycerophosphate synthase
MSVVPATFRSRVRAGVEPIARLFGRVGLTPNALTVIGLLIGIVGAYFAATQSWLIAGLVVAFGAIFDLFDGALARAMGKVSKFGAFLDSTLDRAGEGVVYIGVAIGCMTAQFNEGVVLSFAAMAAGYMVSYVRARAEGLGFASGKGFASVGLAPREVRMTLLTLGLILVGFVPTPTFVPSVSAVGPFAPDCSHVLLTQCASALYWTGDIVLGSMLGLIAVLSVVATVQRILFTYNQSRSQTQEVNH